MTRREPHARPMTRREAELVGLYLAPRQPRIRTRRIRRWWRNLDPTTQALFLAVPIAVLLGIAVTLAMGDNVWVPVTH